jgi:hypothetical protein
MSNNDKPKKTTRVQMDLPLSAHERLKRLEEKTEASSYSEVMKNALRVYDILLKKNEEGGKILFVDKNGSTTELMILV